MNENIDDEIPGLDEEDMDFLAKLYISIFLFLLLTTIIIKVLIF